MGEFNKELIYTVAELGYRLFTNEENTSLIGNAYFEPFKAENGDNIDVEIEVKKYEIENLTTLPCLFKAPNPYNKSKNPLWAIHGDENGKYILVSNTGGDKYPILAAKVNLENRNWNILYNSGEKSVSIDPLNYPMGVLLMYYLTTLENGLMIHASGVDFKGYGMLFTAFSGTGKSTMANLWLKSGGEVINDDRLIIRKSGGKYKIFNTPMYYTDMPKNVDLKHIFLIKQAKENYTEKISGGIAGSRLMAFCIQHNYNKVFVKVMLETLSGLIKEVSISELGFLPQKAIVNHIKQNFIESGSK